MAALYSLLILLVIQQAGAQESDWRSKVSPALLTDTIEETEFIVFLHDQADIASAATVRGKANKGQHVYRLLKDKAADSQAPLMAYLRKSGVEHHPFWIANMIWVRGNRTVLRTLASRTDVAAVYANRQRALAPPLTTSEFQSRAPSTIEPNIAHIAAPAVWAQGVRGQGVVIAGQDTGYDWTHPALLRSYRGWDGASANHNYNWHDAIHSSSGVCGANSPEPCDDGQHGTHTMGTMVGDDGMGNQIGVAPEASWIGCRNMNGGIGSPATYSECFQWFVAPTDMNGENPEPERAPHVINNSWYCPLSEGCGEDETAILQTVVENVRAAGIVVVTSAGNSGALGCGSVQHLPAIYDAAFSVGATNRDSDTIAPFSSRGPVSADGSNRLKPDVVAPGMSIRSAVPGGGYGFSQGTSMASPHVAGLVALLISANPALAGEVSTIESLITENAVPLTSMEDCGGISGDTIPNNTFGYGRIDAFQSYLDARLSIWYYFPVVGVG